MIPKINMGIPRGRPNPVRAKSPPSTNRSTPKRQSTILAGASRAQMPQIKKE
ncbi:MAG: hypothetical protein SVE93_00655 [Candidatus Thermoplasmatota archaeon]|nr:hypothetical protein [Candidatus Thermoplasmatota archaeon]